MILGKNYFNGIQNDKLYLGTNLIYSNVAPSDFTPLTDSNFYTARDLWFTDQAQAETTYGLIENWNTTAVTTLSSAFRANTGVVTNDFNEDISNWDVSNVTDMENMFRSQTIFNQNIGGWNTGNVTNMVCTLCITDSFNQDVSGWNTSNVTNMSDIFARATSFNQNIGGWDVSNVTAFTGSFYRAFAFNQDVNAWDTGNATNLFWMFNDATSFNQNIGGWDISNVTNMANVLNETDLSTSNYDLILTGWEAGLQSQFPNGAGYSLTPSVTFGSAKYNKWNVGTARESLINNFNWTITDGGDAAALGNSNFNAVRDLWFTNQAQAEAEFGLIGDWNTTAVTNMSNAFSFTGAVTNDFNEDISGWDMSNVTNMSGMFYRQPLFNQDLSSWDTSSANNISSIFWKASAFNQPLNSWDVSNVTNMAFSLREASVFNQDLSSWDTSNVTSMRSTFHRAYIFDQNISSWNINKVSNLDTAFTDVNFSLANYNALLIGWEATLQAEFPNGVGYSLTPSTTFGFSQYKESGPAGVSRASLISNFNWTIVDGGAIEALTDSNFNAARDLWFTNQTQAEETYGLIENWNTTAVTNMKDAFKGNVGVIRNDFNEDIGGWDVSNVTDMENMLRTQPLFNQDIGSWDTGKVSKFVFMFYFSTAFNQDISGWDVTGAWNMFGMLEGVVNYNHSFAGWDVSTIRANSRLLNPTNNYSTENYDSTLIGWEASLQAVYPNGAGYTFSPSPTFGNAKYTGGGLAETARTSLVSNFNWTITDGGVV